MFQNLRTNSTLYILHKDANPFVEQGAVVSVSMPKPKYPAATQFGQYPQMEMVVDVTVSVGGQTTSLQSLPAGAEIADFGPGGNIVVACSREAMNNEISMLRQKSVDIVNSRDYNLGIIAACDKMLSALNPEVAAKQQQEQEISSLKKQLAAVSENMNSLMEMNRQLMEQLGLTSETKTK